MYRPQPPPVPPDFEARQKPAKGSRPHFDAAKAEKDAKELAALANQVPAEVSALSQNVLPKDLLQRLKRIQKLAKSLRSEVAP